MKKYLLILPEVILIVISVYWLAENYLGNNQYFNFYAFGILILLILQLFFQNKYVGFTIATLIALFSLYMVLAVISEFHEFPTASVEATKLLSIGLLLCFFMFASSVVMFYKFLPKVF
jgi:VIT1/CCC1 family predicted Fe2+/Mn2+ transporter